MQHLTILLILLFLASGAARGMVETLAHHYSAFKRRLPRANEAFFNPLISWRNKYAGAEPGNGPRFKGSTTYFAWMTDAYHFFGTASRVAVYGAFCLVVLLPPDFMLPYAVLLLAACAVAWWAGFHAVYTFIFNPKAKAS